VGASFSTPVQTDSGAYPTSCTVGTGSFPEIERPGRGADHTPPSSAEVKERVELYFYSPSGPSWPVIGRALPLPFYLPPTVIRTVTLVGPKLSGFPGNSDYRGPDYQEATVEKLFFGMTVHCL
jgi:hypothetical protein